MDFLDKLNQFSKRVESLKDNLTTEEATKTALIMPFFSLLGYDVFNPMEFVPEYIADVCSKKGEKVDYAILKDNEPIILVEAKCIGADLTKNDAQLYRYFTATKSKFAILTDGVIYRFYTDLDEPNKMDITPFLELDLLNIDDSLIIELKKFRKDTFNVETIFETASELKYSYAIKNILNNDLINPSDDFVRYIISNFYNGIKTSNVIDKFRPIVKKSMNQFINDFMNDKLKTILSSNVGGEVTEIATPVLNEVNDNILTDDIDDNSSKIVTTEEEIEGYNIVRSILSEITDIDNIAYKDVEKYFGILYQGNTRKWICRLYFNKTKKSIVIPDENKKDIRYNIDKPSDIYKYKSDLINVLRRYISE